MLLILLRRTNKGTIQSPARLLQSPLMMRSTSNGSNGPPSTPQQQPSSEQEHSDDPLHSQSSDQQQHAREINEDATFESPQVPPFVMNQTSTAVEDEPVTPSSSTEEVYSSFATQDHTNLDKDESQKEQHDQPIGHNVSPLVKQHFSLRH